jgi:tRNA G10  N-methylase Trm11
MLKAIGGEKTIEIDLDGDGENPHDRELVRVVRENHWAVGWVEWIAIHETAIEQLRIADKIAGRLEDYPVVDEELWSEYETEEANQVWKDCYRVKDRIEYIRKHRNQFEFHDFADMLNCVRGKYFAGYASELIS